MRKRVKWGGGLARGIETRDPRDFIKKFRSLEISFKNFDHSRFHFKISSARDFIKKFRSLEIS